MKTIPLTILFFFCFILISPAWCEYKELENRFDFKNISAPKEQAPAQEQQAKTEIHANSEYKIYVDGKLTQTKFKFMQMGVLSVLAVISLYIVMLFIKNSPSYDASHIVHLSALVFIIFGTIFVVILAEAETQFTAATGILGAIAGYLFGTLRKDEKKN